MLGRCLKYKGIQFLKEVEFVSGKVGIISFFIVCEGIQRKKFRKVLLNVICIDRDVEGFGVLEDMSDVVWVDSILRKCRGYGFVNGLIG